jgi:uncharacterized protein YdeI (YjbR/CyaY-like superfamily)
MAGRAGETSNGCSCYLFEKKNVALMHVFKEYCALLYFKGAPLNNTGSILIQQAENVQAAQVRFTNVQEIVEREAFLKACIYEAIEVKKAGFTMK